MEQFQGSERLILQTNLDSPKNSAGFVEGSKIAEASKTSPQDVQNWLKTLEGKGFVEWAKQIGGFSAFVTAKGEQALRLTSTDQVSTVSDGSQIPIKISPEGPAVLRRARRRLLPRASPRPPPCGRAPREHPFLERLASRRPAPDRTFPVGVIYGPSGCGKSSLVRAGLLPRLSDPILRSSADSAEQLFPL